LGPGVTPGYEDFLRGFGRSRKGNLWRKWDGVTLTVFLRTQGGYAWCVSGGGDSTRFSPGTFDGEGDALRDLYREVS
jgi:hypothetical protein